MRAYRSPLKLFVFGMVGIMLIAAAADIMFGHWVSTTPDSNDGVLTTRGRAQQRGDLLWGGAMVVTGVLLFGGSVTELIRRKPTVVVSDDGIRIGGASDDGLIEWGSIEAITSGTMTDPYDGSIREQLIVVSNAGEGFVAALSGLTGESDTLYIDAHDWSTSVTDVALAAQGAHDHFMRVVAARDYEPPTVVWKTTVDQPEPVDSPDAPDEDSGGRVE